MAFFLAKKLFCMQHWWDTISANEKLFWYIAVPFSIILIIQLVICYGVPGGDLSDEGADIPDTAGFDSQTGDISAVQPIQKLPEQEHIPESNGFRLLRLRNFIAFIAFFGWMGILAIHLNLTFFRVLLFATFVSIMLVLALTYFSGIIKPGKKCN